MPETPRATTARTFSPLRHREFLFSGDHIGGAGIAGRLTAGAITVCWVIVGGAGAIRWAGWRSTRSSGFLAGHGEARLFSRRRKCGRQSSGLVEAPGLVPALGLSALLCGLCFLFGRENCILLTQSRQSNAKQT